ncbi:EutP/PduV family microcompartment system protein [Levilactobacillus yiduensis]|uniref:EutP/PduV family microcompartment system protein n=1 Tax=Levilactobacillus yiduensis TaxID=2953880 RepID=UPI000EF3463E|nr:EutP/PduV family microcompartment system protein [Levilactobacillus yiduensis]AYM02420.1 EutP/PduV family microcompartment system protein [Levilactobacillus brevis]
MRKAMFVGAVGCGKTTLIQRLHHETISYDKTQAVEFRGGIIDTPGEFVEHRYLYPSLMTLSVGAKVIVAIQSALDQRAVFPPAFTTMFPVETIGVISKVDAASSEQITYAEDRLKNAGVKQIYQLSSVTGTGVTDFEKVLNQLTTVVNA